MDLMFGVWDCDGVAGFFMSPCGLWVDVLCVIKTIEVLGFGCVWVIVNLCVYGDDGVCACVRVVAVL